MIRRAGCLSKLFSAVFIIKVILLSFFGPRDLACFKSDRQSVCAQGADLILPDVLMQGLNGIELCVQGQ